jgi:hypothetical protein
MLILRGPRSGLDPMRSAEDWKQFLAKPELHWKDGRSAKMLAERWHSALPDMPAEIVSALRGTPFEAFEGLVAIPEYEVPLPGGARASHNDLFVLGWIGCDLAVIMIEGKVDESFGPLLGEWLAGASPGKLERLAFLRSKLGIDGELEHSVRYQLLHRVASPLIEAERIGARYAAMIVHSFSTVDACLDDYCAFCGVLGVAGTKNRLERVGRAGEPELWVGWVSGEAEAIGR